MNPFNLQLAQKTTDVAVLWQKYSRKSVLFIKMATEMSSSKSGVQSLFHVLFLYSTAVGECLSSELFYKKIKIIHENMFNAIV